jgi:hypothetical protein
MTSAQDLRADLIRVLAERYLGQASGLAIVQWAETALSANLDTPSLRILAGLEAAPNEFEVDRFLSQSACELNWEIPRREGCLQLYVCLVAQDILAGRITPALGCEKLSSLYVSERYPSYMPSEWLGCSDILDLARTGAYGTIPEVESEIRQVARLTLNLCSDKKVQ